MLKRPGSPRKRDNTVDFLKIKTYNNQIGYVCKKAYHFLKSEREEIRDEKREEYFIRHVRSLSQ